MEIKRVEIKRVEMASLGKDLADVSLDTLVGTQHSAGWGTNRRWCSEKQRLFLSDFIKKDFIFSSTPFTVLFDFSIEEYGAGW